MSTTLSVDEVKARKEHQCSLCCDTISVGERYTRQVIVGDCLWTWKTHSWCTELATEWCRLFDDDGVCEGECDQVVADLCDHYGCDEDGLRARPWVRGNRGRG